MRTYYAFRGDGGAEVLVLPSVTPNPQQKRIGIRIGTFTAWLSPLEMKELIDQLKKELK